MHIKWAMAGGGSPPAVIPESWFSILLMKMADFILHFVADALFYSQIDLKG